MFTGIVQGIGSVNSASPSGDSVCISVALNNLDKYNIDIGDSIAVNGVCLTVNRLVKNVAEFDVSAETLSKCLVADWQPGTRLNLESALTLQTPLGGHLLSGHVDGFGSLVDREINGEFTKMSFTVEKTIGRFVAIKGSIAINGVSLTVNEVQDNADQTRFDVMLVPHTLESTTLDELRPGAAAHLEVDQLARYVHRIMQTHEQ